MERAEGRSTTRKVFALGALLASCGLGVLFALRTTFAGPGEPARGKPLYDEHCAKCHGASGDGSGRAGRNLDPKPTDFRSAKVDDERWFKVTKYGSKAAGQSDGMEGYGKILSDDQIRDVLAYCKSFKR